MSPGAEATRLGATDLSVEVPIRALQKILDDINVIGTSTVVKLDAMYSDVEPAFKACANTACLHPRRTSPRRPVRRCVPRTHGASGGRRRGSERIDSNPSRSHSSSSVLQVMLCNTSGVLNPKRCHVIICIAHHLCVSENFDMHSLKQVCFYDYMC